MAKLGREVVQVEMFWMAEARIGGGVQAGAGEQMLEGCEGLATLGGSRLDTLGRRGDRMRA